VETISQAVGIRNGVTMMPNIKADLQTVTGLLDRIPSSQGGTADMPGAWSTDRTTLVAEVADAITAFQTQNQLPVVDGVVDPGGPTLRLMNQLAGPAPITGAVVLPDSPNILNQGRWFVADPSTLNGGGPIHGQWISPQLTRMLIRVTGTSIQWFGVVVPRDSSGGIIGGPPHIFFTPSPNQHPCHDHNYAQFISTPWQELWDKYTSVIGSQLVASGAPEILVIPFYKNAQTGDLGDFLTNWQPAVSTVVTTAINWIDPLFLRDTFTFSSVFTSSFSNGIVPHRNFNTQGAGVAAMTKRAFDLDGQASGSKWHPSKGIVYSNTPAPGINPQGTKWFVGGRLGELGKHYPPRTSTHNLCPFLLIHGLTFFG
jgi:hypothetical protein